MLTIFTLLVGIMLLVIAAVIICVAIAFAGVKLVLWIVPIVMVFAILLIWFIVGGLV